MLVCFIATHIEQVRNKKIRV